MRFIVIDIQELKKGINKETQEHGMSYSEARKTAIDHLKERPDYYSTAEKAGLEEDNIVEWNDSIFKKEMTGGRLKRLKRLKGPFTVVGTCAKIGS